MATISARFYVSQITSFPGTQRMIRLQPAYAGGRNKEWSEYTPSGTIEMSVTNPAASDEFERIMREGEDVHITFEAVQRITD